MKEAMLKDVRLFTESRFVLSLAHREGTTMMEAGIVFVDNMNIALM